MTSKQPARRIAERLASAGAAVAFGVPGGGPNLDVIEAFEALGIRFVLAHSETAAAIMASVFGHLSGTPSAVIATRGPGATSVINGAAQATLDRHPLVVITDTVPAASAARVPHQRIDQGALFHPVTKGTARIGPAATDDDLDRFLGLAMAEPPGAVHFDYDEGWTERPAVRSTTATNSVAVTESEASLLLGKQVETASEIGRRLDGASRPAVIVGRAANTAAAAVREAIERLGAPVFCTYQAVGVIPTGHALDAGLFTNGASERPVLSKADLILTIGLDMVEPIPAPWTYDAPVVSLSPTATTEPYLRLETEAVGPLGETLKVITATEHQWAPDAGRTHRLSVLDQLRAQAEGFAPTVLIEALIDVLPPDSITTVDAGAHFLAIMPFHPVANPGDLLISNGLATMGYAIPAAIGASLANPGRPVLAMVGDGGLSMVLAELETIVRLMLPITVVVMNDSALSLIEIKQQDGHGGKQAVRYHKTDFATVANGMGMTAAVVTDAEEFRQVFSAGFSTPRLIDARIDPHQYQNLIRVTRG